MDYSGSVQPESGTIKPRWNILGDGWPDNFEERRALWTRPIIRPPARGNRTRPPSSQTPPLPLRRSHSQASARPRTLLATAPPAADPRTPLVVLPTVSIAGPAQAAAEALSAAEAMEKKRRRLEKPEGSKGCLLRRDLEKGPVRARAQVVIDESNNEEGPGGARPKQSPMRRSLGARRHDPLQEDPEQ